MWHGGYKLKQSPKCNATKAIIAAILRLTLYIYIVSISEDTRSSIFFFLFVCFTLSFPLSVRRYSYSSLEMHFIIVCYFPFPLFIIPKTFRTRRENKYISNNVLFLQFFSFSLWDFVDVLLFYCGWSH